MANENPHGIPEHISPLLQPTPSGVLKLIAAWDGLSAETQILILSKLALPSRGYVPPNYSNLVEKFLTKAVESTNPYVRYLAARWFDFSEDDSNEKKKVKQRIENDPDTLVRYSLVETEFSMFDTSVADPAIFFNLPHAARLAKVRPSTPMGFPHGKRIATLISYALDNLMCGSEKTSPILNSTGKYLAAQKDAVVTEYEIADILLEYVSNPELSNYYSLENESSDGSTEHSKGTDIEALWRLVPKLPEWVSFILILNLPSHAGMSSGIPDDVINAMSELQLETLFFRPEIKLEELRKKMFFDANAKPYGIRYAASGYHFDLTYAEFATILAKPESEKVSIIKDLVSSSSLSFCLYDAIHDVLASSSDGAHWEEADWARKKLEKELPLRQGWQRDEQVRELRLYRLAKQAVPWKKSEQGYPPSGELDILAKHLVVNDTWATFTAFSGEWKRNGTKKLEEYLPRIDEYSSDDTDDDLPIDEGDVIDSSQFENRIENLLKELHATQNRLKMLSYIVIALLVWAFVIR